MKAFNAETLKTDLDTFERVAKNIAYQTCVDIIVRMNKEHKAIDMRIDSDFMWELVAEIQELIVRS